MDKHSSSSESQIAELYRSAASWAQLQASEPAIGVAPAKATRSRTPLLVAFATAALVMGVVAIPRYFERPTSAPVELATGVAGVPPLPNSRPRPMASPTTVRATPSDLPRPAPVSSGKTPKAPKTQKMTAYFVAKGPGVCGRLVPGEVMVEGDFPVQALLRRITRPGGQLESRLGVESPLVGFAISASRPPGLLVVNVVRESAADIPVACRPLVVDSLLRQSLGALVLPKTRLSLRLRNSEEAYRKYISGGAS